MTQDSTILKLFAACYGFLGLAVAKSAMNYELPSGSLQTMYEIVGVVVVLLGIGLSVLMVVRVFRGQYSGLEKSIWLVGVILTSILAASVFFFYDRHRNRGAST